MNRKWRLNSIVGRTGLYSFIIFGIAMFLLVLSFVWISERQLRILVETENEDHVQTIVKIFDNIILNYHSELRQKADAATLVNAVMDPDNTGYYLPDYMKGLGFRNISGNFLLLTFDGMIVSSTNSLFTTGDFYTDFFNIQTNGEIPDQILFHEKKEEVCFISRILYNEYTEGYLIFITSISSLFDSAKFLFESFEQERFFSILSDNNIIIETKKKENSSYLISVFPLETLPVKMGVGTNTSGIGEPMAKILFQIIFLSSISVLFLAIFFSVIISRKLTRPLLILEKGIKQVGRGNWEILEIKEKDPLEIQFLRRSFNEMQKSIINKNKELTKSNTSLKEAQRQLIQSEKMASLGQLAAGIAHEINNPCGFVTNNLQTMTEYTTVYKQLFELMNDLINDLDKKNYPVLGKIQSISEEEDFPFILEDAFQLLDESIDGTNRIKKIVQELRNFARTDNKEFELANINTSIEDALRLTWNELKYNCEIEKELDSLPDILCRADQLTQVFVNLFVNASHAISDHGKIKIISSLENDHIIVTVSDTGAGITEENISKLFDPFFTTKDVGKGTGLGLAISFNIIEEHGGIITVDSILGDGTCFSIRLPIKGKNL